MTGVTLSRPIVIWAICLPALILQSWKLKIVFDWIPTQWNCYYIYFLSFLCGYNVIYEPLRIASRHRFSGGDSFSFLSNFNGRTLNGYRIFIGRNAIHKVPSRKLSVKIKYLSKNKNKKIKVIYKCSNQ